MSCVHYKFSSKLDYNTVTFDGLHITLSELKRQIMARERLKATDCDLQITNAQTREGTPWADSLHYGRSITRYFGKRQRMISTYRAFAGKTQTGLEYVQIHWDLQHASNNFFKTVWHSRIYFICPKQFHVHWTSNLIFENELLMSIFIKALSLFSAYFNCHSYSALVEALGSHKL